jgi:hypothetical protein
LVRWFSHNHVKWIHCGKKAFNEILPPPHNQTLKLIE